MFFHNTNQNLTGTYLKTENTGIFLDDQAET